MRATLRSILGTVAVTFLTAVLNTAVGEPASATPQEPPSVALVNCNVGAWWGTSVSSRPHVYNPTYNVNEIRCVLGVGNAGSAVTALQHAMVKCNGAKITVDGIFGPKTRDALIAMQRRLGISDDGVYGPQTNGAMRWPFHTTRSLSSTFTCFNPA